MSIRNAALHCLFSFTLAFVLVAPGSALADWTIYGAGHFGISTGVGEVTVPNTQPPPDERVDTDRDSGPMLSASVGLEVPMNELIAWKLPYDLELPTWPVRSEIEFTGLRSFQYRTLVNPSDTGPDDVFLSDTKSWSMMFNAWFDVPSTILTRPLAWTFQSSKQNMRRALEPISFYAGTGVGTGRLKLDAISTLYQQAKTEDFTFAWQVGTGVDYRITPFVHFDLGYRFFKMRESTPTVTDGVNPTPGEYRLQEHVHELRAGLRVNIYSFTSPWNRLE